MKVLLFMLLLSSFNAAKSQASAEQLVVQINQGLDHLGTINHPSLHIPCQYCGGVKEKQNCGKNLGPYLNSYNLDVMVKTLKFLQDILATPLFEENIAPYSIENLLEILGGDAHGYYLKFLGPLLFTKKVQIDPENPLIYYDLKKIKTLLSTDHLSDTYKAAHIMVLPNLKVLAGLDNFRFLGDFFDRGPMSAEILLSYHLLFNQATNSRPSLIGNHDSAFWFKDPYSYGDDPATYDPASYDTQFRVDQGYSSDSCALKREQQIALQLRPILGEMLKNQELVYLPTNLDYLPADEVSIPSHAFLSYEFVSAVQLMLANEEYKTIIKLGPEQRSELESSTNYLLDIHQGKKTFEKNEYKTNLGRFSKLIQQLFWEHRDQDTSSDPVLSVLLSPVSTQWARTASRDTQSPSTPLKGPKMLTGHSSDVINGAKLEDDIYYLDQTYDNDLFAFNFLTKDGGVRNISISMYGAKIIFETYLLDDKWHTYDKKIYYKKTDPSLLMGTSAGADLPTTKSYHGNLSDLI